MYGYHPSQIVSDNLGIFSAVVVSHLFSVVLSFQRTRLECAPHDAGGDQACERDAMIPYPVSTFCASRPNAVTNDICAAARWLQLTFTGNTMHNTAISQAMRCCLSSYRKHDVTPILLRCTGPNGLGDRPRVEVTRAAVRHRVIETVALSNHCERLPTMSHAC